jgi:hypothetical protein
MGGRAGLTKPVLETALERETSEYLGYGRHDLPIGIAGTHAMAPERSADEGNRERVAEDRAVFRRGWAWSEVSCRARTVNPC